MDSQTKKLTNKIGAGVTSGALEIVTKRQKTIAINPDGNRWAAAQSSMIAETAYLLRW